MEVVTMEACDARRKRVENAMAIMLSATNCSDEFKVALLRNNPMYVRRYKEHVKRQKA